MIGDFDQGRSLVERGRAMFEKLGITIALLAVCNWTAELEELAGDLEAAEEQLRVGLEICRRTGFMPGLRGFTPDLRGVTLDLARLADLQERHDEAEELVSSIHEEPETDDRWARIGWLWLQARRMARCGEADEAVRLANEMVGLAPPPEAILDRAFVLLDAAEICASTRRFDQAAPLAEEALRLHEQKGSLVSASKARARLAEMRQAIARGTEE